jgi:hypothetical protein
VGSDAAAMPLEDAFADRMALHCSFEHFEGRDNRFVAEAEDCSARRRVHRSPAAPGPTAS